MTMTSTAITILTCSASQSTTEGRAAAGEGHPDSSPPRWAQTLARRARTYGISTSLGCVPSCLDTCLTEWVIWVYGLGQSVDLRLGRMCIYCTSASVLPGLALAPNGNKTAGQFGAQVQSARPKDIPRTSRTSRKPELTCSRSPLFRALAWRGLVIRH